MVVAGVSGTAGAQPAWPAMEGAYGGAWFVDESPVAHHVLSGACRWPVTPKLAIGPEASYMIGPGSDRDFILTGNVTYTFRARDVAPFVVGGAGLFRHTERFASRTFTSSEGAFTAGGGIRIPIGRRWYVAPEARFGWELHTRIQIGAGMLL
jgi:hypothetical protein